MFNWKDVARKYIHVKLKIGDTILLQNVHKYFIIANSVKRKLFTVWYSLKSYYYVIIIIFYPYRKLPHGLHKKNTEVCLFVKDLDKKSREHELTSDHFKDLLRSKGITCVSEVSVQKYTL